MQYKILIVDDEADIRTMLQAFLAGKGFDVVLAQDAQEAIKRLDCQIDIILLDVNMPGIDGFSLCKQIRNHVGCPIIFLTAKVEEEDKLTGFAAGGDDYVVKPFSPAELLARLHAHLRREERHGTAGKLKFCGGLVIDYAQRSLSMDGQSIPLVKKEFDIIEFLSLHPGQVFDKERIYEHIWGWDSEGNSCVVTEHIRRIRSKMAAVGAGEQIETVWGVGYKWKK